MPSDGGWFRDPTIVGNSEPVPHWSRERCRGTTSSSRLPHWIAACNKLARPRTAPGHDEASPRASSLTQCPRKYVERETKLAPCRSAEEADLGHMACSAQRSSRSAVAIPRSTDITGEGDADPPTEQAHRQRRDTLEPTVRGSTRRAINRSAAWVRQRRPFGRCRQISRR
jgi:hypothetical protein